MVEESPNQEHRKMTRMSRTYSTAGRLASMHSLLRRKLVVHSTSTNRSQKKSIHPLLAIQRPQSPPPSPPTLLTFRLVAFFVSMHLVLLAEGITHDQEKEIVIDWDGEVEDQAGVEGTTTSNGEVEDPEVDVENGTAFTQVEQHHRRKRKRVGKRHKHHKRFPWPPRTLVPARLKAFGQQGRHKKHRRAEAKREQEKNKAEQAKAETKQRQQRSQGVDGHGPPSTRMQQMRGAAPTTSPQQQHPTQTTPRASAPRPSEISREDRIAKMKEAIESVFPQNSAEMPKWLAEMTEETKPLHPLLVYNEFHARILQVYYKLLAITPGSRADDEPPANNVAWYAVTELRKGMRGPIPKSHWNGRLKSEFSAAEAVKNGQGGATNPVAIAANVRDLLLQQLQYYHGDGAKANPLVDAGRVSGGMH
ncbi:unnamed protein product [Amoebophrya sp. A25]|nr:unnamed protein product [Amoebophrya sp. A25]|eukprot:GSA25T00012410001.1